MVTSSSNGCDVSNPVSGEVCIQYDLGRHGWSKFRLNVGTASVVVGPFGYCTDALGDLVRAALMLGCRSIKLD